jgi:multisubunit Na+/H+ antiporter MnhC subunit
MNVVPQIARRSGGWGWFFVWAFLGAAAALGTVSLGPLLLLPIALLGVFLLTRPAVRRSAFGLLMGAGALLLYVAWVQRDGPGTTCWHTATASGCDQHLNPLPWLIAGTVLVVSGFVAHVRRT